MANKYAFNNTLDDLIEEEDRECTNDLARAKTHYYKTLTDINLIILDALKEMESTDIKKILTNNKLTIPVKGIIK